MSEPKTVAIIQARSGGSRLAGKVLMPLAGKPMLFHCIDRALAAKGIDEVRITSPYNDTEVVKCMLAHPANIKGYGGEENDLLGRFLYASKDLEPNDVIVRLTADNPLVDIDLIGKLAEMVQIFKYDYVHYDTYHIGLCPEAFTREVLERLNSMNLSAYHREHVTSYIRENPHEFKTNLVRFTVDTPMDYAWMSELYDNLYKGEPIPTERAKQYAYELRTEL